MSKVVLVDNLGNSFRFNDINCISSSQRHYFIDGQSDPIDLAQVWNVVKDYATPTQEFVVNGTDEQRHAMNEQYYWLFGDAFNGGMAFRNNGSSMFRYLYSTTTETQTSTLLPTSGICYLYPNENFDGEQSEYMYEIQMWQDGAKLRAQYVNVYPTTPPSWVIESAETPFSSIPDGFGVQSTWDYFLPDLPIGACRNSGASDGWNIEIAGITIGLVISPCIEGGQRSAIIPWWDGVEKREGKDPYAEIPESTTGGGDGTTQTSIDINFPDLPPDMLLNSGIVKFYNPSASDLNSFINYIYSRPTDFYTNVKKLWANPMDSIISLAVVPFGVVQGESEEVKFCGLSTGLSFPKLASQYQVVNCGKLTIEEEYCNFCDYGAFTKIKLWLPFIGIVDMNTDDTIGATLEIRYNCDCFTGECMAFVKSTKNIPSKEIEYNSVIYCFQGNILQQAPLTGNNYASLYSGILNIASHVALPVITPAKTAVKTLAKTAGVLGTAGGELLSEKVNVQRSGTAVGNMGTLGEYHPYVIIERPLLNVPANNGLYNAYPLNKTYKLGQTDNSGQRILTGFTVVRDGTMRVNTGHNITDEEKQEIKELLESGVIL